MKYTFVHNNERILFYALLEPQAHVYTMYTVFSGTREECELEMQRLNLTPIPLEE